MRMDFVLEGSLSSAVSADLTKLQDALRNADTAPIPTSILIPKVKEPITIGLAIASLAVSSIGTVLAAISFWKSQHPKYSISVEAGEVTYQISNLKPEDLREIAKKIGAGSPDQNLLVRIREAHS